MSVCVCVCVRVCVIGITFFTYRWVNKFNFKLLKTNSVISFNNYEDDDNNDDDDGVDDDDDDDDDYLSSLPP